MADISKIKVPNGSEYNLKDAAARTALEGAAKIFIDSSGYISIEYPATGGGN